MAVPSFLTAALPAGTDVHGYEIHMGRIEALPGAGRPIFHVVRRNGVPGPDREGTASDDGLAVGTLLHGLFESQGVRASLLVFLRRRRNLPARQPDPLPSPSDEYDRLAAAVRAHIDVAAIRRLLRVPRSTTVA